MTTIVIADDHRIIRDGLHSLLESEADFTLVGEAASGTEAIQLCVALVPDILIVDLSMPDISGFEVMRHLQAKALPTKPIVLSMHTDRENVLLALQSGAMGYIVKDYGVTELIRAIHEVLRGHHYLSPNLSDHVITTYLAKPSVNNPQLPEGLSSLTDRELEVLKLCAGGYSIPEIAKTLLISVNTAKTHRSNMMRKLKLHNQSGITRYALEHGLLSLKS
jgi:DNA-binding NarL/FixJ family response regulator